MLVLLSVFSYLKFIKKTVVLTENKKDVKEASTLISQNTPIKKTFIFVPYWTFSKTIDAKEYDSIIYFGIGVDKNGIDTKDDGYKKIKAFVNASDPQKERMLTVRMTNGAINSEILKNDPVKKEIIIDSIQLAKENAFNGVLLDFETSAFGFEATIKRNSDFYSQFAQALKKEKLLFYVSVFGDNYFQSRAYDIKEISKNADKVIVMAYDFHKTRSNPGPIFPFDERQIYGYDFKKMVEEFQKDVPAEKLVIALGYFGYDWKVDKEGNSTGPAIPLSLFQMQEKFENNCKLEKCSITKNNSLESQATYMDGEVKHIVWSENQQSAEKKIEYLKSQGIFQTAAWAYSYF